MRWGIYSVVVECCRKMLLLLYERWFCLCFMPVSTYFSHISEVRSADWCSLISNQYSWISQLTDYLLLTAHDLLIMGGERQMTNRHKSKDKSLQTNFFGWSGYCIVNPCIMNRMVLMEGSHIFIIVNCTLVTTAVFQIGVLTYHSHKPELKGTVVVGESGPAHAQISDRFWWAYWTEGSHLLSSSPAGIPHWKYG